jgi:hypothetical protein
VKPKNIIDMSKRKRVSARNVCGFKGKTVKGYKKMYNRKARNVFKRNLDLNGNEAYNKIRDLKYEMF